MATLAISPFPVRGRSILENTVAHDLKPQKGKKKEHPTSYWMVEENNETNPSPE
jgi:hypothetical protein